jgi:hypothetical protein
MGGVLYMFKPDATDEQVDAAFKFFEARGQSPKLTEEIQKSLDDTYRYDNERGFVVGNEGVPMWVNPEWQKQRQAIIDKYVNVDLRLFQEYADMKDVLIKPEPPISAQELYKALDSGIQQVLTDKNADPAAILEKCCADFQRNYLDKLE